MGVEALAQKLGFSRASFWGYRTGGRPISAKAWSKLEAAERDAGIETFETPNETVLMRKDPQRDKTLAAAREFNLALEPTTERLVQRTIRTIDGLLSTAAFNDGEMADGMIRLSHKCVDDFAAEIKTLRAAPRNP